MRHIRHVLGPLLFIVSLNALLTTPRAAAQDDKIIHVGIAITNNQSRRMVATNWARNELVRQLKDLRKDKKSAVVIDAIPLDSSEADEALREASEKNCRFVVMTTLREPMRLGDVMVSPEGINTHPQMIGNADPHEQLAIKFAILRPGSVRTFAEGLATAPAGENDDMSAAREALRIVALRVASELRKERAPAPE
jgi:hypothetical protein